MTDPHSSNDVLKPNHRNLPVDATQPPTSFAAFANIMTSRRAIRVFDGTPVPEQVMREALELALLTPSSSNLQPWEFHWVRSKELRPDLVRAFIGQSAARTASEIVVAVARTQTWDRNRRQVLAALQAYGADVSRQNLHYYESVCCDIYNQGLFGLRGLMKRTINAVLGLSRAIVRSPASHGQMKIWAVKSTAMACQSLILALQASGYETCPIEGLDAKRMAQILKLPSDAVVVMGIAVGRRAYNGIVSPRIRLANSLFIKEV